jgi:tetratricopeptide (TPR) repeat protein
MRGRASVTSRFCMIAPCFLAALLAGGMGRADDVNGTITVKSGKSVTGVVRWKPLSKVYEVTVSNITQQVSLDQVTGLRAAKPAGIDDALLKVQNQKYSEAIPVLEKICSDYEMLQWDVPAAKALAEAHLAVNNPAKALVACDKVIGNNPAAAISGDLAKTYWTALLKDNKEATLNRILAKAVVDANPEIAASAHNMRGDIEMQKGNFDEALISGYLRTIALFKQAKQAQPEALYKASKCFEQLRPAQLSNADKMKKRLLAEYPQDPYAEKLKSDT